MTEGPDTPELSFTTIALSWSPTRLQVRLNRPEHHNAINRQMVDELHAVFELLEREPRLLVITGGDQGRFAAGADIAELRERRRDDALAGINLRLFERLRALPLP